MCLGCDTATRIQGSELQSISVDLTAMAARYHLSVLLLSVMVAVPAAGVGTLNSRRPDLLPENCGRGVEPLDVSRPLIVGAGNTTAYYGQFPWQARIEVPMGERRRYGHKCGGIIITSRHVLTAAHCIDHVPYCDY